MTITGWMWFRYFTGSHLYFCEFLYGFGSFGSAAAAMDSKVMQCKAMASCARCMVWPNKLSVGLCVSVRTKCFK